MNRSLFWLAALLGAGTVGCDGKDDGIEDEESDADADADTDADADADADADTDADTDADAMFEPVAAGFELIAGWDEAADTLTSYNLADAKEPIEPFVVVTIADLDYFSLTGDEREGHYCTYYFDFISESADIEAQTYTTDGSEGDSVELWAAYEGYLLISGYIPSQKHCNNIDPEQWPDLDGDTMPDPWAFFHGMHFGVGFGDLSEADYLMAGLGDDTVKNLDKYPYLFAAYIAINHPTGDGGYDFIGYDWNLGYLYQWDNETHELLLDDKGAPIPGDVGEPFLQGVVETNAFWYEDYPNIDLDLLIEGGYTGKK